MKHSDEPVSEIGGGCAAPKGKELAMIPDFHSAPDDGESVNIDAVRERLRDYYGTAMQQFPMAVIDLAAIDSMSDAEVIREARKAGII